MIRRRSISLDVSRGILLLTSILLLPATLNLAVLLRYAFIYSAESRHIGQLTTIRTMLVTELPERMLSVVSGHQRYEEAGIEAFLADLDRRMQAVALEFGDEEARAIARREADTLLRYAEQIRENLAVYGPHETSEALLADMTQVLRRIEDGLAVRLTREARVIAALGPRILRRSILVGIFSMMALSLAGILSRLMRHKIVASIREPIEQLQTITEQIAAGDFSSRARDVGAEELVVLSRSVNTMADRLQALIEQNRAEQEALQKAELRTLQAQIQPHFLYNTLEAIVWQAEDRNREAVIALTRALSDFFRIALSSGRDWITVEQEVRHLSAYLSIQQMRYRDVLRYTIDVAPELMDASLPKLLLQPLAENALYHGIKEKRGGGLLSVSAQAEGAHMRFTVSNTGRGMTPERLAQVRQRLAQGMDAGGEGGQGGFGLRNVDARIRLYYGISEGLHITSGPEGTSVTFRVPIIRRKEA